MNADLGESFGAWILGDDAGLLDVITSANVACGFHAGDPRTILRTVTDAAERGVVIGAQVSFPDLVGFGRRDLDATPEEITADVLYQIGALDGLARAAGSRVHYVKPHGALYNRIAGDARAAGGVVEAVRRYDETMPLMLLSGSVGLQVAGEAGLNVVGECFADRAYTAAGRLVSRREPGAVIGDPDVVVARVVRMATEGVVVAVDGTEVRLDARSVCVHGDTPGAAAIARQVRDGLVRAGVSIVPFAGAAPAGG
ncbi:MAG TPA: 5-oxoprolinase subunit PxpA [Mycobacteriales bacterium]|nr:5-oxoprolinase subunit PxpA [Mycobacteriales bacterium]